MPAVNSVPSSGSSSTSSSTSFWVLVGAGVTLIGVSVGVIYYFAKGKDEKNDDSDKAKANTRFNNKSNLAKVTVTDLPDDHDEAAISKDPLERALAAKNKGNKYFRGGRYDLAIQCYSEAIDALSDGNSKGKSHESDLATFYQNRAAASEKLNNLNDVVVDCSKALELNSRYVKALDRRAKVYRKQAQQDETVDVAKLKQALEDITAVCILEGFQKQEHLLLVDSILKELGKAEAKAMCLSRRPVLTSDHFVRQYFQSFSDDPIAKKMQSMNLNPGEQEEESPFNRAVSSFKAERYENIIENCTEEVTNEGPDKFLALLLRGTFYILSKQQKNAFEDLGRLIDDEQVDVKIRANALIKRASLFIQRCEDPVRDPESSFADFARAVQLDGSNADVYHHRGQVHLLVEQIDLALNDFEKSTALNPDFPIASVQKLYTEYRKASAAQEDLNGVLKQFKDALDSFPNCVEAYALYAQVLSDQSRFDEADELYVRAQKIDPNNANLLVHRGLIRLQWKGDVAAAMELIEKALKVDDKCEFAYETLGTVEVQRGNMSRAIELFSKAEKLANTELEMAHIFGLKNAAMAQEAVSKKLGLPLQGLGM